MELTNVIGVAFQVNVDSVVYAVSRTGGATLLLSKGGVMVEVEETVAEVVTASDSGLVSFTASSGDLSGAIAVNPNYIQSVTSVDSGNSSQLVICDNTGIKATVTVTTDYSAMDAIIEAASGGGAGYLVYTALLTQTGTDAPVATVLENTLGGTVVWTYNNTGDYIGTLAGVFLDTKTWPVISNAADEDADFLFLVADVDSVELRTRLSGTPSDDVLYLNPIEIRVYP